MEIYLVRHTSVDVPKGVCYGQTDVPLKESFLQEAEAVKANLQEIVAQGDGDNFFDAVYTSPLSRCTRLAEHCGYGNAARELRIMEINFGRWEMQEFGKISDPRLEEWYANWLDVRATDGESFRDQYGRVSDFLNSLKAAGMDRVLLFAHGGVLACAKILSGQMDPKEAFAQLEDYGAIIKVEL